MLLSMPEISGFFYGIETAHYIKIDEQFYQIQGFGITGSPKKRLMQYSDHAGTEQKFHVLYHGDMGAIKSLENIVKQTVASKSHKIYGQRVEWVDPMNSFSKGDLIYIVDQIISREHYPIRKIKDLYLPFKNSPMHQRITNKDLSINPAKYLEEIG